MCCRPSAVQAPADRTSADPLLGGLSDNGGPTDTQALLAGSAAIDAASGCPPPSADQRGLPRPQGAACDAGAFEVQTVPPAGAETPTCQGKAATIVGTAGKDKLKGTKGADVIAALAGNDSVSALAGNDRVCAGDGKDKVSGGGGKDRINGENGADVLRGGGGNDKLKGGKGNDKLKGGKGKDKLLGQGGTDKLNGGPGRDVETQ
jgi:Ca2+-binding RTX toxin-like protein